jgi:hypothetical protein
MDDRKTEGDTRGWPVKEVAEGRGLVDNLLDVHVPDEWGRCVGCAVPRDRRPAWPCGPRRLAEDALRVDRQFRPAT